MPLPNLKSLKGLRRKSPGNSIDESTSTSPVGSSFRVIPRDEAAKKSVGGPIAPDAHSHTLKENMFIRQNSDEDYMSSNRGSGSTGTSTNSRIFDSASGTRLSSSSTLQSPVEAIKKDSTFASNSLQSSTFTGISTEIDTSDGFGDIFAGLTNRRSQLLDDNHMLSKPPAPAVLRTESEPYLGSSSRSPLFARTNPASPPSGADKSPYSLDSRTSQDGLLSSPPLDHSPSRDPPLPPVPRHMIGMVNERGGFVPVDSSASSPRSLQRSMSNESFTTSAVNGDADAQFVKESVKAVRASTIRLNAHETGQTSRDQDPKGSVLSQKLSDPPSGSSSSGNSLHTPSMTSSASSFNGQSSTANLRPEITTTPTPFRRPTPSQSSTSTTPRAKEAGPVEDDEPMFDESIVAAINNVGLGKSFSPLPPPPPPKSDEPKKVYTATQFEILKKHAERQPGSKSSDSDSDDDYEDDEDDEATILQKRKMQQQKEAQHLIWRQRMTKDIGDQSSPLPGRPTLPRANQSTPNLTFGHASKNSTGTAHSGGSSDDEDIPLGVLQAHGFPKKDTPVDPRLSSNSYVGRPVSTVGLLPRPASPARSAAGGNRNSVLPPFARRLPQDPYMGQKDLVNPANRESMGFNRASATQSMYLPAGIPPPIPQMPGGLVGVIAEEERQRGMRRGSPNAQVRQSTLIGPGMPMMPPLPGMSPMGMVPGVMPMMSGPAVSPEQLQLNQQMFQLMQQQAAMLEQMYNQMAQLGPTPSPQQNGFLQAPVPQGRPMSMASSGGRPGYAQSRTMSMINVQPPLTQRTMSMVNLPNQGWGQDTLMSGAASVRGLGLSNGYAPSVAPSERSNIGHPTRYKPVQSSYLADGGSTITAGSTVIPTPVAEKKKSRFLSAIIHPAHKGKSKENITEEEDEDDWSSFAKKRKNVKT